MKVYKSINNNIVSAYDDDGNEVVVIGKGIGYHAKEGDFVPEKKIEKIFMMKSHSETERLKEQLASIPDIYLELADKILTYAKAKLNKKLHEGANITLADHINFVMIRVGQNIDFSNVLLNEIKRFYSKEFEIGLYAIELMKETLGVDFPDDEAASIALHIFNAEYDISISDAFHSTQLINNIIEIIEREFSCKVNNSGYYYERFLSHLKYLAQRIIKKEKLSGKDPTFYKLILAQFPVERACSEKIAEYITDTYGYTMTSEEISGLTLHFKKIIQ